MNAAHKICSTCKLSAFEVPFRTKGNQCKPCYNLYMKNYLNANPDQRKKNRILASKSGKKRIAELREWYYNVKRSPCVDCKQTFHPQIMEFDHREDKERTISDMVLSIMSKDKIEKEMAKCDLVCVLCHRIRTIKRRIGEEKYFLGVT